MFSAPALAALSDRSTSAGNSTSSSSGDSSDIKVSNNQFGYQSIMTIVDYTETGNGQFGSLTGTLDTETGSINGNAYYVSIMKDVWLGNDYFKATYDQTMGVTNYVGGALPNGAYGTVVSTSSAILKNYSVRYGKGFERGASMVTPYVELGSHRWDRGVNFGETYTNMYSGFGLLCQYSLGNRLVLTVDALYGHTTQSSIAVTSGPGLTGFSGSLGNSELYKLGISADYALIKKLHVNAGIDYIAFAYGISATYPSGTSVSWEPDSQTNYTIAKIGLGWEL